MSKIAITGAATGTATFTIESPATSTNRTLTIPDATTTIVGTDATQTLTNKSMVATQLTGDVAAARITTALNATGSAPIFAARAWVNFDGTTNVAGNCTIMASGNVSSITDNGTGQYTMNFTTAMPDIDYVAVGSGGFTSSGVEGGYVGFNRLNNGAESAPTTSALRVNALSAAGNSVDQKYVYVAIFR